MLDSTVYSVPSIADPTLMKNVLANLVREILDFSGHGGTRLYWLLCIYISFTFL